MDVERVVPGRIAPGMARYEPQGRTYGVPRTTHSTAVIGNPMRGTGHQARRTSAMRKDKF